MRLRSTTRPRRAWKWHRTASSRRADRMLLAISCDPPKIQRRREGCSPVLAPDPERFLRRPVRDTEQHHFAFRPVRIALPRRNDEHVARRPFERLVLDLGRAPAFDADEDRA